MNNIPADHRGCVLNPHGQVTATCIDHHVTVDLVTGHALCPCGRAPATARHGGHDMCPSCATELADAESTVR